MEGGERGVDKLTEKQKNERKISKGLVDKLKFEMLFRVD